MPMAPASYAQSDVAEQINNLTQEEQDALKNLNVSDNLQEAANDFTSNIKPEFTETDREALKLLGYSDQEIDQLSLQSLSDGDEQDKFKSRLNTYANNKGKEIEAGVMNDLVPGLGSAVLGLAFASLLGIVVGVRCYNQPSALAFAGTSAAWVGLEMMIWKGYQINMDDINTLQNATKIPQYVEKKIARVKKIIGDLETEFKKQDPKELAEGFESFLADNKEKVDELRGIAEEIRGYLKTAKDRQFGALRSIQESIALAAETSKKKSRNAKVAAIGYTAAAGLAAAEAFNVFNAGGTCVGKATPETPGTGYLPKLHHSIVGLLVKLYLQESYAGFASVGDLDKIGIPLGGGLAAAYLGFEKTFADKIYSSPTGRGLVFLAMAGIAYLAYSKLEKAAAFLEKQANEMDIFVSAIEDKLSKLNASFPDGAELIRELKEELMPEVEEILNGLADKEGEIKDLLKKEGDRLVDEKIGELGLSKEELEKQVKEQVNSELQFTQNDIAKELQGASSSIMSELNTSDLSGRLTTWQQIENYLIPEALAATPGFKHKTPVGCVVRTRGYVRLDEACNCRGIKKCIKTRYPTKLKMAKNNEFGAFSYKLGSLVAMGSEQIFNGRPDRGVKVFQKAGSLYSKMELNTRKLLSQKVGKKIDHRVTARMISSGFHQLKPGLPDFYRGQGKMESASINPKLSNNILKNQTRNLMSNRDQRSALKASLRNKLALAKKLGNKSLQDYRIQEKVSGGIHHGKDKYNYSKEAITRDSTKDIFMLIKKRYLIIQSQGRLSL